jgi:predicted DNA-binding transcriptional regulator AlpA
MDNQNRPFLTMKEVSVLLGILVSTIDRLIKKGEFPPKVKISPRRIVFMKYQIYQWIQEKDRI